MKKVVLFGDSLTAGFNGEKTTNIVTENVTQDLINMGYPMTVINKGKIGDTTSDALSLLNEVLGENPDYVTIFFGNDLSHGAISKEVYLKNIQAMVEMIGKDKVILIAPAYVDPKLHNVDRKGEDIHAYGKVLMDYAKENDISHIDMAYRMTVYPAAREFLQKDGLHFSKEGNELFASLIAKHVKLLEMAKEA